MVRRATFFALAAILVLSMVTLASAAQNVANTSQKGSLLIFPKIIVQESVDTIISIGNDYFTEVWVKCYWMDSDQQVEDFLFRLTPNQPVYFYASTGEGPKGGGITVPPFGASKGELKCWAVNANGDTQRSFNHLYGNAVIFQDEATVAYNAWSFTARQPLGTEMGSGELLLNGTTGYDACPTYLVTNFMAGSPAASNGTNATPDLTLVPCKQDLRQDRTPTCTKAKFDVWNANETKFTGAYQCLKCFYEGFLNELGADKPGFGADKFTYDTLHTMVARFRVQGIPSTVCKFGVATGPFPTCPAGAGVSSPFVGVLLSATETADGILPYFGTTPFGGGADGSGFIRWDADTGPAEVPGQ